MSISLKMHEYKFVYGRMYKSGFEKKVTVKAMTRLDAIKKLVRRLPNDAMLRTVREG